MQYQQLDAILNEDEDNDNPPRRTVDLWMKLTVTLTIDTKSINDL